ncbi:PAS domain S-box protein [Leptolyngbya sp. FACHB-36]|uniref:PAS domain S-box protein n=1 Tax=Leptolyngbya sp. FACHB-36 TaxID=2692808 RepID=UPI001680426B|nr:PAS domain S-box protein [Leptolyngbya sp. FACHB-36]MBD2022379.1 PAS domain S-box protein [Leptolyngbya sp. FACHB-36]
MNKEVFINRLPDRAIPFTNLRFTWIDGWHYFLLNGTIALACLLSAKLPFLVLKLEGAQASPVWFPAGVALAALLLCGRQAWTGVALGTFLFGLSLNVPWGAAAVAAFGNTIGAIVGEWLLRRMAFQPRLRTVRDVLGFVVLAGMLSPAVNATISTLNGCLAGLYGWNQFGAHWWTVWLGDGMGILVVTPLLLTWVGRPLPVQLRTLLKHQPRSAIRQRVIEALIWAALLLGVSWLVFQSTPKMSIAHYPLEYLPFPLIIWAALRLGQRGTVLSSLLVSVIAIWGAVQHGGPFLAKTSGDLPQAVLLLQAFVGVITVTALVLAAAVAERQEIEDRLRESEERFRGMFEGAAIGIGLDDLQGRIIESNPALQSLLGYRADELQRLTFADFTHPDDIAADAEQFQAMIAGKLNAYQLEKRHVRKDGQTVWIRLTNSLVRDAAGNPKYTIGMVENITQRKQAEDALQQSEARFRVVAETAACAFLVYQQNRLCYVNSATEVITGYTREELLAMDFWQLAHPDCREMIRQRGLARQRGEAVPNRYEIKILTKTGSERWVDFNAGMIVYEGHPAALATATDITDRKLAEGRLEQQVEERTAELKQRMRELHRSNQVKDLLLHAVSHDLRTPVQGMRMVLNGLRNRCHDSVMLSSCKLDLMIQTCDRQLQLLNSLQREDSCCQHLDVCLNREAVSLSQMLQSALKALEPQLILNQVTLVNQVLPELPPVSADPAQIQRVFEQLLNNAIKHNPPGGTLTLKSEIVQSPCPTTPMLRCAITDNGVGIGAEQRDRLFHLYVRGEDNRRLTGIGLGLHTCQQIVSAHGGQIGIDSELGEGSTFWFTLPLALQ